MSDGDKKSPLEKKFRDAWYYADVAMFEAAISELSAPSHELPPCPECDDTKEPRPCGAGNCPFPPSSIEPTLAERQFRLTSAAWDDNGFVAGVLYDEVRKESVAVERTAVSATVPTDAANAARYRWLANRVLACDYGDNDAPGQQIGWRIRHDLLAHNGERQPAFMYGKSIDEAIDAAMAPTDGGNDA
jgi:hypothetical protein